MYPILFKIGSFPIQTVGLLHALAFAIAVAWVYRQAKITGKIEDSQQVLDLSMVIIVWSVIGARLFSILFDGNLSWYLENPKEIFMLWHGGFTFYGGFIFGTAAGIWYVNKHKMDIWKVADLIAPALALGLAFGRLGCFASGDSFGKPTDLPWGVVFTDPASMAPTGVPLHPTQIYSVLTNALVFFILIKWQKRQKFTGQIFLLFVILYAFTRSFVEIFRNDPRGVYLGGIISTSQIISILVGIIAIWIYYRKISGIPKKAVVRKPEKT